MPRLKFAAWDQNLLTEWHMRYGGRGVMVYWHVGKKALCIYSQFKRVSSSEAGAMINGVVRQQDFPNLATVMAPKPINWDLIEEMFDSMVKHLVALRLRMTDADSLLRRFTRLNAQHPVYKAFLELGKAIKTIFLCSYLASEEIRREVHEGLNVVESWNNTNKFIFYGNEGELATNLQEDQEMGLLALHLLQASMVYINTLMIQEVLASPEWSERMTPRDLAALCPLLTMHINRYGHFDLDMETRLPLVA